MNQSSETKEIYVGIDESGSSKYLDKDNIFVLCAVAMSKEQYEKIIAPFSALLDKIGSKELKYSKSTNNQIKDFLKIMDTISFKTFYITKNVTPLDSLVDIYKSSILELADILNSNFDCIFNIKIDEMYGEIRQSVIKKKITGRIKNKNKIQYVASHKSIIVQIADMYAGLKRKELLSKYKNK
jgi:hypothetical protein